jgi:hypothetical protein
MTTVVMALLAVAGNPAAYAQQTSTPIFEVRTYTANPGRLQDMHETFRSYWTKSIFPKHAMTSVIYLAPTDTPHVSNTMIYLLQHESREAADASWQAFLGDPEVQRISRARNANGRIVAKVDRVFAKPTDFSPIQRFVGNPELTSGHCDRAAVSDIAALCRVNAAWDEANLKMSAPLVQPILDEQFVWVAGESLRTKADIVEILRTTDVRFSVYESVDVHVYASGGMAYLVGFQNRRVAQPAAREPERWRFTRTFVKRGTQWLILSHHYTRL